MVCTARSVCKKTRWRDQEDASEDAAVTTRPNTAREQHTSGQRVSSPDTYRTMWKPAWYDTIDTPTSATVAPPTNLGWRILAAHSTSLIRIYPYTTCSVYCILSIP